MFSKVLRLSLAIFFIFFLSSSVYAICSDKPTYITLSANGKTLGEYGPDETHFIGPDVSSLKYTYTYVEAISDTSSACIQNAQSLKSHYLSLYTSSLLKEEADSIATPIKTAENQVRSSATVTYSNFFPFSTLFTSQVLISNNPYTHTIAIDSSEPILQTNTALSGVIKGGDNISLDLTLQDSESGLKSISITGGVSYSEDFDGEKSKSISIPLKLTQDGEIPITIRIEDRVGNILEEELVLIVDAKAPEFIVGSSGFKIDKTYTYSNGKHFVDIGVTLYDRSFDSQITTLPTADLSVIHSVAKSQVPTCSKTAEDFTFRCLFRAIPITQIDETKNVDLVFTLVDNIGNEKEETINEEIFIDSLGPQIQEFKVVNSVGRDNFLSVYDDKAKVVVSLHDDDENDNVNHFLDLDVLPLRYTLNQTQSRPYDLYYVYDLYDLPLIYEDTDESSVTFTLRAIDSFSNTNEVDIEVILDRRAPELFNAVWRDSRDGIEDGIISSNEKISFDILVRDLNLEYQGEYSVFADLSNISYVQDANKLEGRCRFGSSEDDFVTCSFDEIEMKQGYINSSILFYAIDAAGNIGRTTLDVEIFAREGEAKKAYTIKDASTINPRYGTNLRILNPLNRNLVLDTQTRGWFKGKVIPLEEGTEFRIINFQLLEGSCNETSLESIVYLGTQFFPNDIVRYKEQGDEIFALQIELGSHEIPGDLNEKELTCTISVLKRDATSIYPPELINISMFIEFYDLPNNKETLLRAHATKLLDMINNADVLGKTGDKMFGLYNNLHKVCYGLNSANQLMAELSSVWTGVSIALHAFGYSKPVAKVIDKGVYTSQGTFSSWFDLDENSILGKTCQFVTCQLSFNENVVADAYNGLHESISEYAGGLCTT